MSTLNAYTVVSSEKNVVMFADVEEFFNTVSGDIDQVIKCNFYNATTAEDIGYAKVKIHGQHQYVSGDINGKNLINKFQIVER